MFFSCTVGNFAVWTARVAEVVAFCVPFLWLQRKKSWTQRGDESDKRVPDEVSAPREERWRNWVTDKVGHEEETLRKTRNPVFSKSFTGTKTFRLWRGAGHIWAHPCWYLQLEGSSNPKNMRNHLKHFGFSWEKNEKLWRFSFELRLFVFWPLGGSRTSCKHNMWLPGASNLLAAFSSFCSGLRHLSDCRTETAS